MRLRLRLQKILEDRNAAGHGAISRIAKAIDIERHKAAALFHGDIKSIGIEELRRLCDYLCESHQYDRHRLPGDLFRWDPEGFWALLCNRAHLELCVGARGAASDPERRMINEADAHLQSIIIRNVTSLSGGQVKINETSVTAYKHGTSPRTHSDEHRTARGEGLRIYDEFSKRVEPSALVGIGSIKSNPVIESIIARSFGATPFVPDPSKAPAERKVPFAFVYREEDAKVSSCLGGGEIAIPTEAHPGIAYEDEEGHWTLLPCDLTRDAGVVFYEHHLDRGVVQVVIGGFTANATRCLARDLESFVTKLWAPGQADNAVERGAFIIPIEISADPDEPSRVRVDDIVRLVRPLERRFAD